MQISDSLPLIAIFHHLAIIWLCFFYLQNKLHLYANDKWQIWMWCKVTELRAGCEINTCLLINVGCFL